MHSKNIFKTASTLLLATLFSACGGGGGGGSQEKTATPQSATFIDDVVTGIKYVNGVNSGYTDANGKFPYSSGSVQFYIGNIKIGEIASIPSDNKVFIQDLLGLPRTNTNDAKILKIATFIQSIDSDPTTPQIEIPEATFKKFEETSGDILNIEVDKILEKSGFFALDTTKVQEHLQSTLVVQGEIKTTINQFKSSSLANNATNVDLNPTINLEYDLALLLSIVNSSNIYLKDSLGNNIPLTFTTNNKTISITPSVKLAFNTDYILSFRNKINLSGEDVLGDTFKNISFKTKAQTDFTAPTLNLTTPVLVNENQTSAFKISATDESAITYSLGGTDGSSFNIDSTTGVVTFKSAPDYETKNSYKITVTAMDSSGNKTSKDVVVNIGNLDENAPQITTASTLSFDENSTNSLNIVATDESAITYSLGGTDGSSFNIDSTTGVLTFKSAPDYETKNSYKITVTATDSFGNKTSKDVVININNISSKVSIQKVEDEVSETESVNFKIKIDSPVDKDILVSYSISGDVDTSYYETPSAYSITIPKNKSEVELSIKTKNNHKGNSDKNIKVTLTQVSGTDIVIDETKKIDTTLLKDIQNKYLKVLHNSSGNKIGSYVNDNSVISAAITSDNNMAFISTEKWVGESQIFGIDVLDISNPKNITKIATYNTDYPVNSMKLSADNTKAYILLNWTNIKILDISTPSNITLLASSTNGSFNDFDISDDGETLFAAAGNSGVKIFDISNSTLEPVAIYETSAWISNLKYRDNKLYVANGNEGLIIIDVSDLANLTQIGVYNSSILYNDIDISPDGTKLYLAKDNNPFIMGEPYIANSSGLTVLDISNLDDIHEIVSHTGYFNIYYVKLSEDNKKVYMLGNEGFVTLDVSDLQDIYEISNNPNWDEINGITFSDDNNKIFVAGAEKGFEIYDNYNPNKEGIKNLELQNISNKLQPLDSKNAFIAISSDNLYIYSNETLTGSFENISPIDFYITKDEKKLYVLTSSNIYLYNIENLASVSLVGKYLNDLQSDEYQFSSFSFSDDEKNIFLADSYQLKVIDSSNFADLNSINMELYFGTIKANSDSSKIYYKNGGEIGILDISDLSNIDLLNSVNDESYYSLSAFSVENDNANLNIANDINNFQINNNETSAYYLKDSSLKRVTLDDLSISTVFNFECPNDFKLSSNSNEIYILDCDGGLGILDINNESNSVLLPVLDSLNKVSLSRDNSEIIVYSTDNAKIKIKDLSTSSVTLPQSFGSSTIDFKLDTNFNDKMDLYVTLESSGNLISLGDFDSKINKNSYEDGQIISIPITSISNEVGQEKVVIKVVNADKVYTQTVYVNIYPSSTGNLQ